MIEHQYIVEPDCPDCAVDPQGRFVCLQSREDKNGISCITLCAGIDQYSCDYKAAKQ